MAKHLFYNNFRATLAAPLAIGATSMDVDDASQIADAPLSAFFLKLTIVDPADDSSVEIIRVNSVSDNTLSISRAQEGTVAREWLAGARIEARLTAEMLGSFVQGFLPDTEHVGSGAINLQTSRGSDERVARGMGAVAVGGETMAAGEYSIADGHVAAAYIIDDLEPWQPATPVFTNNIRRIPDNWSIYFLYCIESVGSTGSVAPNPSVAGEIIQDGGVVWVAAHVNGWSGNGAMARGFLAQALGDGAAAVGASAVALGDGCVAIGRGAKAVGRNCVAIGDGAEAFGDGAVKIGQGPTLRLGYDHADATYIGDTQHETAAFQYGVKQVGFDYLAPGWTQSGEHPDPDRTARKVAREITLYSVPVQLGDAGWPGAEAVVSHGYAIRANGLSFVAQCETQNSERVRYRTGVTGLSEPSWPMSTGATVSDGTVKWLAVDASKASFLLPPRARFSPTAIGVITTTCEPGSSATYPHIEAGVFNDPDLWLSPTEFDNLTGPYANQFKAPTSTENPASMPFCVGVETPGTDLNCVGYLVVKGYVIETPEE